MRRDVLELMAEELGNHQADVLASFTAFDGDGRRRLDGMSKGKRWDIDREQREFEKAGAVEIKRLMKLRCRRKNPGLYRATAAAYEEKWKGRRRLLRLKRYRANAADKAAKLRAWRKKKGIYAGTTKCTACREPGHNKRTCREAH